MAFCTGRQARRSISPGMEGRIPGRAFFLVDKQGIVRAKWIGEDLGIFPTQVLLQGAQEVAQKP